MTTILLIGIILAGIAITIILWSKISRKKKKIKKVKRVFNKEDAEKFVERLDELGYFKYASKSDRYIIKKEITQSYDLTRISLEGEPKDYRYYSCDGEDVYKKGGVIYLLNELKPTFTKIHFVCKITNHFEEWDHNNEWLNHRITINGTEYVIFKNFPDRGWGEAPKRIAEILNMELSKQGIKEKLYLVNGGNDGGIFFLTDELYKYIYSTYKNNNPYLKPLELEEWAKVMKVKPMNLN